MIAVISLKEMKKTKRQIKLHKRKLKMLRAQRKIENIEIDRVMTVLSGYICLQCKYYTGTIRKEGQCFYSGWREDLNKVQVSGRCRNYAQKT